MRRLRIVLAPSAYDPNVGGIEEVARQLALQLAARGHHPTVLTNRWPAGLPREDVVEGVDVLRLDFPLPAMSIAGLTRFAATTGVAVHRLLGSLRRNAPDVIHVIGAGPQSAYLAALRPFLAPRIVFSACGELTFDANAVFARSTSLRLGLRLMLARADAVTACSAHVLRDLKTAGAIEPTAIVIPNGVDPSEFSPHATRPTGDTTVLAIGRLVPQKGFDVLLEAAADPRLESARFVIAGDGSERAALEQQTDMLGISDRVAFVGTASRAQLASLFREAAAFALPSRGEAFGIVLLEAMAAGVPAVATTAGGIPEFGRDGDNALLVPPESPTALADALVRITQDNALAGRLTANGRATAEAFAWGGIAERYERVYSETLER
jgi:glycosyltransferase involved in cell wall biosynthesis